MQRDVVKAYIAFTKAFEIAFLSGLPLYAIDEDQDKEQMQIEAIKGTSFNKLKQDIGEDG